jgi:hypothetical protein
MLAPKKDENEPLAIYKNSKSYQHIVRDRYNITNQSILYDDRLLLMIYAYEWFQIPDKNIYEKVCYNPYITNKDYKLLNKIYDSQKFNVVLLSIFGFLIIPIIKAKIIKKYKIHKHNWKPELLSLGLMIALPVVSWFGFFQRKMNKDIKGSDLNKYLSLDLNKEKIKEDLLAYNIVV